MLKLGAGSAIVAGSTPPGGVATTGAALPPAALDRADIRGAARFEALNVLTGFAGGSFNLAAAFGGNAGKAGPVGAEV
ncbi:MAG TPA: hypothetical protein VJS43_00515, partial [Candidatus Acidoferrales bacterium]|nr:hypothetical protein [Candidatus Acidoferrales bacterium]